MPPRTRTNGRPDAFLLSAAALVTVTRSQTGWGVSACGEPAFASRSVRLVRQSPRQADRG